jgi:hypothetical protein
VYIVYFFINGIKTEDKDYLINLNQSARAPGIFMTKTPVVQFNFTLANNSKPIEILYLSYVAFDSSRGVTVKSAYARFVFSGRNMFNSSKVNETNKNKMNGITRFSGYNIQINNQTDAPIIFKSARLLAATTGNPTSPFIFPGRQGSTTDAGGAAPSPTPRSFAEDGASTPGGTPSLPPHQDLPYLDSGYMLRNMSGFQAKIFRRAFAIE